MVEKLPHITILLCTFNGAKHLTAQLESYVVQSHQDWALWVSDDGSDDATLEILSAFQTRHGALHDIRLLHRLDYAPRHRQEMDPGQRAAANFMALLNHPDLPSGAVALSDQDDVWLPDKLALALAATGQFPDEEPVLYGAQSQHVNTDLIPIGKSRAPRRPPCFTNALTQNIISGHSTALNAAALALVRRAGIPANINFHDWWLYQFISGAGGRVHIDSTEVLLYRQHVRNVMGAHNGLRAFGDRIAMVMGARYGHWIATNVTALTAAGDLLTDRHRDQLVIMRANRGRGPVAAWRMARAGLHRQGALATMLFYLAVGLGRV